MGFVKGVISFISDISVNNVYHGLLREGLKVSEAVRDDSVMQHLNMGIDYINYMHIYYAVLEKDTTSE